MFEVQISFIIKRMTAKSSERWSAFVTFVTDYLGLINIAINQ